MPVLSWDDAFLYAAACTDLVRSVKHRVASTALVEDVSDQMLLSVVGGEDADALRRVSQQTHIHEQRYSVLCFCQVLYRKERKSGATVIILPQQGRYKHERMEIERLSYTHSHTAVPSVWHLWVSLPHFNRLVLAFHFGFQLDKRPLINEWVAIWFGLKLIALGTAQHHHMPDQEMNCFYPAL